MVTLQAFRSQGNVRRRERSRLSVALTAEDHAKNNLPDVLSRWARSDKADIAAQGYDLSLNRYKEVVHEEVVHRPPGEILKKLAGFEREIMVGMKELEDMLK